MVPGRRERESCTHSVNGSHEHILRVPTDGDLILEMVVDEFGNAVKGSSVEAVLYRGSVATVHYLLALNESVVHLSAPEHAEGVGVGEGRVLPHEEVPLVVEQSRCVVSGELAVKPRLHLQRKTGVDVGIVAEAEPRLHRDHAQVVRLVQAGGVATSAAFIVVGGGVGGRTVPSHEPLRSVDAAGPPLASGDTL